MAQDGTAVDVREASAVHEVRSPRARPGRVLLVDDERCIRESVRIWLSEDGHEVITAATAAEALLELRNGAFDVLITDVILEDRDGIDLVRSVASSHPEVAVVAFSGYATIPAAVEAIKSGAFDFLCKPLRIDEIRQVVRRAVEQRTLLRANRSLRRALESSLSADAVIGRSHQVQRILDLVDAVADSKATVLIRGETGTGKSLIARVIHQRSQRRARPFVEVSCGAIPETLLESELFGHVRGAFTGALADKAGKFRAAEGGTAFLDEVSAASPSLQVKLLRVLQDRQFEPLGSNKTVTADVRVILATNLDLQKEVDEGRFRRDLFYRINVVVIDLPPLRERLSDIPLLAEHFLHNYAHQCGRPRQGFSEDALQCMQRYAWPGNVRELENCVERAVVLSRNDPIGKADLPPAVVQSGESSQMLFRRGTGRALTLKEALAEPERRIIEAALDANDWNRQRTAEVLDVNRTTLYKKMKRFGLLKRPRRV